MKMRLSHILIVLTLISCEMVVDVDVPPPPELLVLNSTFDSEGNWSAKVSKNQYILDEDPPVFFNDATLTVTRPDGSSFSLETKPPSDDFFYDAYLYSYKDESVLYGEPYLISAEKEGFPIATSASVIPKPVQILLYEIDTTTFFDQQGLNTWNGDNKLSVTFQDVEGESFYGLRLKTMVLYYGFNYETQTEEIDTVDRYVYLETENPIVEDYMNSSKELVFTDQSFAGKEYNFVARFSGNDIQGADLVTIEFLTITEAYYAYKSSQRLQEWVDGDPFAAPVNVRSNIENGHGIFAGIGIDTVQIQL
jgi:hypothetical protein